MRISHLIRSMLHRRGNIAGSLVAQTLAVAVMFATLLLGYSSGQGPGITYRYADADAVVRISPTRLLGVASDMVPEAFAFRMSDETIQALAAVDGVAAVIPDRTFRAQVLDEQGSPIVVDGHDASTGQAWRTAVLTPFALLAGEEPQREREVVIDRAIAEAGDVHVGDSVEVLTQASTETYTVVGIAAPPAGDALPRQVSMFFSEATVEQLAPTSQGTVVAGVIFEDSVDESAVLEGIRTVAAEHSLEVLVGPDRGRADLTAGAGELGDLGILFLFLGAFVGFVAIFVIGSTFGFAIQQRTREIALQRAIGYTPGQVRRAIALEAAVIGLLGGVMGVGIGTVGAFAFIEVMQVAGRAPDELSLHFWANGIWVVLIASLAISQLAVFLAGRRASRIRPVIALREGAARQRVVSPIRTVIGGALVACAVACLAIAPSVDVEGAIGISFLVTICGTVGIACLAPTLVYLGSSFADLLFSRRVRATTRVAIRNGRARAARAGSAAGVIVLTLGFATLIACFNATLESGVVAETRRALQADIFVVPQAEVLAPAAVEVVRDIDGVDAVSASYDFAGLYVGEDEGMVEAEDVLGRAVDPASMGDIVDVPFEAGSWDGLEPGTVIVTAELASWMGLDVGSSWTVTMPDMTEIEVHVTGVVRQPVANAEALFTIQDVLPHLIDPTITEMLVTVEPGAQVEEVIAAIEAAGKTGMPMAVVDKEDYIAGLNAGLRENAWAGNLIIGGAAAFAGIAAINTVVMSTWERGREFSMMRLIGSLERQILQMVNAESILLALSASAVGIAIGVLSATVVSIGLVGDASALTVPVVQVGVYGAIATLVIMLAASSSARARLRDVAVTTDQGAA